MRVSASSRRRRASTPRSDTPKTWSPILAVCLIVALSILPRTHANPTIRNSGPFPISNTVSFPFRGRSGSSLIECLTSDKDLEVVTPVRNDSAVYHEALLSHNVNFQWHPLALVYPRTEDQVGHALACANQQKGATAVAARSGSCSFAAFGTGGMDGSLVIDLSHFDFVKVLPVSVPRAPEAPKVLAKIGPGVRLGGAVKALWAQGKRGIPHGTCPQVGMGGHALCGGFGPLSRNWGLTTDNIVSMDVFLPNGTKVTASSTENQELFWGMRGAGAKLVIVTSFTMNTYDASGEFTNFAYTWTNESSPITTSSQLAGVAEGIQNFAARKDFPSQMGMHLMIHTDQAQIPGTINTKPSSLLVEVRGMYAGPKAEFKKWGDGLLSELKKTGVPQVGTRVEEGVDYLTLLGKWDDFATSESQRLDVTPSRVRSLRGNFWARTHLTLGQRGFSRPTLERAFDVWFGREAKKPTNLFVVEADADGKVLAPPAESKNYQPNCFLELFGGSNSAVMAWGQRHDTAFTHRNALWAIQCSVAADLSVSIQDSGRRFLYDMDRSWRTAMAEDKIQGASYSCYVDATLKDWREMYYGAPTMRRLEVLKMSIDPHNVVRNPHAILRQGRDNKQGFAKGGNGPPWIQDAHPMP